MALIKCSGGKSEITAIVKSTFQDGYTGTKGNRGLGVDIFDYDYIFCFMSQSTAQAEQYNIVITPADFRANGILWTSGSSTVFDCSYVDDSTVNVNYTAGFESIRPWFYFIKLG